MNRFIAAALAGLFYCMSASAWAGKVSEELRNPDNHELDPIATVREGPYRYELTDFSCVRNAELQSEGTSPQERKVAAWASSVSAAHPKAKYLTRYNGSAYDTGGCYEPAPKGIRVFLQGSDQPMNVTGPVLPCDPANVQLHSCAPAPTPAVQGMPAQVPRAALSQKLVATLNGQPRPTAERFLFDGRRPAVMWDVSCKEAAQMQGSEMAQEDAPFLTWQASQPGALLTVERIDGTFSEACFVRTARGIRIWSFGADEPIDSNWQ
jgi:hypothetical protein